MLKINRLTDYAIVLLVLMARRDRVVPAQEMCRETGVPLPTVAKLMKQLVAVGLVRSHRGISGGYSLGRAPSAITVADMVQAVEGPIALTACVDTSEESCTLERLCPMHGPWNRVNRAVRNALETVSLADLVGEEMVFPPQSAVERRVV